MSSGPLPFNVSMASMTSRLFPTASPRGWLMSVTRAIVLLPAALPMSHIRLPRASASFCFSMKAPLPHLTSRTMASLPAANFLLIILEAISPSTSTVPVTSLSAYNILSAGVICAVCPITAMPTSLTCFRKASGSKVVLNPGIDSSLSTVPPVNPRPRPLILAMGTMQAAAIGATISVVLSPTPPVECLSTLMPLMEERSTVSPEYRMALVSSNISSRSSS